mmetsp:Transcript_294/g.1085  ORF Transcript_294/g.1085 Transcript_294/m.1085 type:complete len:213 (+) Transcript_294:786-1424(+)
MARPRRSLSACAITPVAERTAAARRARATSAVRDTTASAKRPSNVTFAACASRVCAARRAWSWSWALDDVNSTAASIARRVPSSRVASCARCSRSDTSTRSMALRAAACAARSNAAWLCSVCKSAASRKSAVATRRWASIEAAACRALCAAKLLPKAASCAARVASCAAFSSRRSSTDKRAAAASAAAAAEACAKSASTHARAAAIASSSAA